MSAPGAPNASAWKLAQTFSTGLSASETRKLLDLLESSQRSVPVRGGHGRTSVDAVVEGAVTNFVLKAERRRQVERGSLPLAKVAAEIGAPAHDLERGLATGRLIGLRRGGEWWLPMWQFNLEAADPILPGLADLIRVFPGSVVALSRWVERRSAAFDGNSPAELLRRGEVDRVVQEAAALQGASGPVSRD
ncbi:hypothetical protein AB2L27_13740 [Kineococcus sp. LSe6-4]|uniref:Antitoxin Xre/MbcA/ParS-like toxin-binding domain-containing protein n=1 Tax=Kineococcus halophytocola TaxID=3234027 RepID=A0ABV4H5U0_9ACTN